jgi:hypothetical protein
MVAYVGSYWGVLRSEREFNVYAMLRMYIGFGVRPSFVAQPSDLWRSCETVPFDLPSGHTTDSLGSF